MFFWLGNIPWILWSYLYIYWSSSATCSRWYFSRVQWWEDLRSVYLTLIRYTDKSGTECPVEIKWKSCHRRDVERASWWYTDAVFVWNGNCLYNFWSKYIQVPSSEYSSSDWRVIYSQYMPRGRFGKSKSISQAGAAGPCFLKLSLQNTDRDVQFFMAYKYHSRSFVSTKRHYTRHDWQDFRVCWTLQI